jgi:hypothetical protein
VRAPANWPLGPPNAGCKWGPVPYSVVHCCVRQLAADKAAYSQLGGWARAQSDRANQFGLHQSAMARTREVAACLYLRLAS